MPYACLELRFVRGPVFKNIAAVLKFTEPWHEFEIGLKRHQDVGSVFSLFAIGIFPVNNF
jgi:hypothetical protein